MMALPCSRLVQKVPKPLGNKYIQNPVTLGEKLRNRRLELRLFQKDVAKRIGVTEDCIAYWEKNRSQPTVCYYPALISFLGYFPFDIDTTSFGGKITYYRYLNGLTQEELAKELGVNESTVYHYEKGTHRPFKKALKKLELLLAAVKPEAPHHILKNQCF
jgi:transcriptional regulator with XRE-family HTH domain